MKNMYKFLTLILVAFLGTYISVSAQSSTFGYTGAVQSYTVPAGVTSLLVEVDGARGGAAGPTSVVGTTTPGCGGRVQGIIPVTPGQVLTINVGGVGAMGTGTATANGGYPNGGSAAPFSIGATNAGGGGGGGRSEILSSGVELVVAGGGGGAGYSLNCPTPDQPGGAGGGLVAGNGVTCDAILLAPGSGITSVTDAQGGNTLTGPPSPGGDVVGLGYTPGGPGGSFQGGNTLPGSYIGGGGGDGYVGGGGGGYMGGGGGSSYTDGIVASVTHTQGVNCAGGFVSICALPNPGVITGPSSVCGGNTINLTNPTATGTTGTWSTSATAVASIGSSTGAVVGGAFPFPITVNITYTATVSCGSTSTSTVLTVNPSPAAITGPSSACSFDAIVQNYITLSDATTGGTFSAANPAIANVADPINGIIEGGATAGVTTISYTVAGCSALYSFTTNPAPAPIVSSLVPAAVCVGLTTTLTDASTGGTWISNNTTIATIGSATGVAGGVGTGGTTVVRYVGANGCPSSIYLTVNTRPGDLFPANSAICQGAHDTLYEYIPGGRYTTSVPSVATVTAYGIDAVVTGSTAAYGTTVVTYTIPGCPPTSSTVTVNPNPAPIGGTLALCSGAPVVLTDASTGGTWTAANATFTVDPVTGLVTPNPDSIGRVSTVIYTLPTGCKTTAPVNLSLGSLPIVGANSVCLGAATTLADASTGGTWSSTNLAVAQVVGSSGLLTGITAGTATISYTLPSGCYSTLSFTVDPLIPAVVSVAQSPTDSVCAGVPVTLTATSTNSGIDPVFSWSKFENPLTAVGDTTAYVDSNTTHGDVIIVQMIVHGVCAVHDTVYDTVALNIYPISLPHITISTESSILAPYVGCTVALFSTVDSGGAVQTYQWYENNLAIPGATASTYSTAIYDNATFYCVVSGNPICSRDSTAQVLDSSNKITFDISHLFLGTGTTPGISNISLFPNPNTGSFVLSGNVNTTTSKDISFEISDVLGHVVYNGKTTAQNGVLHEQITLDDLSPGTYLLRLNTSTGNQVFHFVVSK